MPSLDIFPARVRFVDEMGRPTVEAIRALNGIYGRIGGQSGSVVQRIAMTVPDGLQVSGSPITERGTFAVSFQAGYSIPSDARQSEWDSAYGWGNHADAGYLLPGGDIGAATGASLAVTGALRSSGVQGIGYDAGAGGAVTQATSKTTGVTLNAACGEITMNAAALASGAIASFTLTNASIGVGDVLTLNHVKAGTRGAYGLNGECAAGSAAIHIRNNTAGSLSEAIVIRFAVIKGATA